MFCFADESVLRDLKALLLEAKQKGPPFLDQMGLLSDELLELGVCFLAWPFCSVCCIHVYIDSNSLCDSVCMTRVYIRSQQFGWSILSPILGNCSTHVMYSSLYLLIVDNVQCTV